MTKLAYLAFRGITPISLYTIQYWIHKDKFHLILCHERSSISIDVFYNI